MVPVKRALPVKKVVKKAVKKVVKKAAPKAKKSFLALPKAK